VCSWYDTIQKPDDLPVSGLSERYPGKTIFLQVQNFQKVDENKLIDFFGTTTQLNILKTCTVKVVVGCNNNVRGFHENLVTIQDL